MIEDPAALWCLSGRSAQLRSGKDLTFQVGTQSNTLFAQMQPTLCTTGSLIDRWDECAVLLSQLHHVIERHFHSEPQYKKKERKMDSKSSNNF